jgi:CAP12/Pycsar effector protein, TIR domain
LIKALDEHDFAIFVFFPDDVAIIKYERSTVVRDNVLFKLELFVGKLGRQRNFFVVPRGEEKLRLATDLAGVVPGTYDPAVTNPESSVAPACYYIRQRIQELGSVIKPNVTLYDSSKNFRPFHFEGVRGQMWEGKKPISPKGEGSLRSEEGGVLRIERSNTDGRFEIRLGPPVEQGQKLALET